MKSQKLITNFATVCACILMHISVFYNINGNYINWLWFCKINKKSRSAQQLTSIPFPKFSILIPSLTSLLLNTSIHLQRKFVSLLCHLFEHHPLQEPCFGVDSESRAFAGQRFGLGSPPHICWHIWLPYMKQA